MTVDPTADRAVFRQVADLLRQAIMVGELPPGAPLPSEATLCQRYDVSRVSVRRAVATLRSEGLVTTVAGRGSFVVRQAEREPVRVEPGATVTARPAAESERRALGLAEGWPVLVVTTPGGDERVLPADRTALVYGE